MSVLPPQPSWPWAIAAAVVFIGALYAEERWHPRNRSRRRR